MSVDVYRFNSSPCLSKCDKPYNISPKETVQKILKNSYKSIEPFTRSSDVRGGNVDLHSGCGKSFHKSMTSLTPDSLLNCSVQYNDSTLSPYRKLLSSKLLTSARSAVVHRVCGLLTNSNISHNANHPYNLRANSKNVKTHLRKKYLLTRSEPRLLLTSSESRLSSNEIRLKDITRSLSENDLSFSKYSEAKDSFRKKHNKEKENDIQDLSDLFKEIKKGKRIISKSKSWYRMMIDSYGNSTEKTEAFDTQQLCNNVTKQRRLRHTRSDMNKSQPSSPYSTLPNDSNQRQSLGRQYSSPHPIKERPLHRLPDYSANILEEHRPWRTKTSSANLRRSVSQPLDLDKSFQAQVSLLKIRIPDESSVQKGRRRPSVGNLLSEENSSDEDDGLDCDETRRGFKSLDEELIVFAEALWDHVSLDADELVFKAGDLITVIDSSDKDWWWGRIGQKSGWFPASFVRLLVNQNEHESKDCNTYSSNDSDYRKSRSISVSHDQVRANVINEIISTERDYVKHLRDVVEGYLKQVKKRPDMFSDETITVIFGNMESLYNFHSHFLDELESCIDYEEPHLSCIGECFIRNKSKFEIYSEYCNNHPSAVSELQDLYQDQRYVHFFEACRLLQQMIDISLDGFLLTPVQKICKYPLQLQELLKYTRSSHIDYSNVLGAMRTMREVALLVNERRRRMECLEKIATWQRTVEGWEGPELLEDSSQLIHQGEVIKGIGGAWPKEVNLFLFDHQMVYCKRDLLKRSTFVYRGRINTDLCEVIDIPDDPMRSAAFHHSWKIHCLDKGKTYVFTCKTEIDKTKWLQAFKKERGIVATDETSGFVVSEKQKQGARMSAKSHKYRPKRPRMKNDLRKEVMTFAQAQQLISTEKREEARSNSLPTRAPTTTHAQKKKGHWFSFGGNKKSRNVQQRTQPKHGSFLVS